VRASIADLDLGSPTGDGETWEATFTPEIVEALTAAAAPASASPSAEMGTSTP
jgi:hypothetical protein